MWTAERQNNYGGKNQVLANMRQSLGITNRAHDNSKTGVFFNFVARASAVNYTASSSNNNIISDLRDGRVSGARDFRDRTGADVMGLNGQMSAAGVAFVGDPRQYAIKFLTGPTTAHEIGHSFGCGHGGVGSGFESGGGDRAYAGGWAFRENGSRFGTIMTGAQIMWYSTPERTYRGRRTGIGNTKDNTRRIRETRRESSRIKRIKPWGGQGGGWWYARNRFSNIQMGLASNNSNNGTRLTQSSGRGNYQQWRYDNAGVGGGWLTSRNRGSGKAIDKTGRTSNGHFFHQWAHNPRNVNQHLKFDTNDTGLVRLRFRGGNKIITHRRQANSGAPLIQYNWNGASHMQWYMERVN